MNIKHSTEPRWEPRWDKALSMTKTGSTISTLMLIDLFTRVKTLLYSWITALTILFYGPLSLWMMVLPLCALHAKPMKMKKSKEPI